MNQEVHTDGVRVSRTLATELHTDEFTVSIGASYTHITTLRDAIQPCTSRIVMYHAMLESLDGLTRANHIAHAYLGFNRIRAFGSDDCHIHVDVLDLAGNPLTSLVGAPMCRELIVSATLIRDLRGLPEGVEIVRCGHSTHLQSLLGCPNSVQIIEASCAPNMVLERGHLPAMLKELIM